MKYYESTSVVCPFYTNEDSLRIHCEGNDGSKASHQLFSDRKCREEYKHKYCENDYKKCCIAAGILKKWDESK